ncbi:MAG: accessory factor UbiK family protein [Alphaproteobacteria bacterium]
MQNKDTLLDDLAKMAGGTMSVLSGLTKQVQQEIRMRVDEMAQKMDLVPREDFERVEALVVKQREELNALKARIDKLDGKKPAPKKAAKK